MVITRIAKKFLITVCCFILGLLLVIGTINYDQKMVFAQESNQLFSGNYSKNSIIVVLDEDISEINKIHNKEFFEGVELESVVDLTWRENNPESKNDDFRQILQLNLKEQNQVALSEIIGKISNMKGVKSVEPNYMVELDVVPNDSNFEDLWGLYGENGINAVEAWGITIGHSDITVGIIDTGIANHPDLNANLKVGYDFYNDSTVTSDDVDSHGTHVAGTIGAVGDNYIGVVGINWNVTLVALQAANADNRFYTSDVIDAIEWAEDQWGTNNQIDIINYSVSGFGANESVLEAVRDFSGLFVWSAGNNETDIDEIIRENGLYDLSNLISVGAIKENGERASVNDWGYNVDGEPQGSNYSSSGENVNIYAPGHRIYSTVLNSNYANKSGTSMAAPHVSGVAALVLSINPNLSAQEVKNIILDSADNSIITLPDGTKQSVKKLNALSAVSSIAFETNSEGNCITGLNFNPTNGNLEIPSIINGITITSIGAGAFSDCTSLTSINIPANVSSIGAGAFAGCSSLTNITIPAGVTSIGEGAFAGCSNLNISVNTSNPNYSVQGNILYNKAKTKIIGSGDIAANITIPNTVTEVGESAFSGNSNLQRVDIYGTPVIDDFAFYDCANLDEVYFYSYTVPEIGAGAFSDNIFTVYVPYNKQSSYYTIFSGYTDSIDSIPITVTLKKDGVAYQTVNTYYGADISGMTDPYKEGYTFNYWVDTEGNTYQNGDVWDSTVDLAVEADWTARQFHITFSGYGSENLDAKSVTYDQPIGTLPVISKTGNTFNGWKDEYGVYYTADTIWQRTSNLMLTSDFSPNEYTITYNGNGGTESISTQNVEYGTVVNSLATATKTGYTFTGWNVQADGTGETISAPYTYEIANDITLYAQYTVNTYTATFDKQGGNGGLAGVEATYGEAMPTTTAPTRTGYTFGGYYSQTNGGGTQYYDEDMNSMHVWNYANAATLYAKWVANTYTVTLQVCYPGGANSSLTSQSSSDFKYINYTATESTMITIWTTHTSGDPYLVLYNENLSQLAYNDDGKGNLDSKITYTVTSGVTYVIGFRGYGSRFTKGKVYISKDITATYGSAMPSNAVPTQVGYTFEGYYTAQNGNGTKYYNSDMSSANNWNIAGATTLYANWTAHVYTVILNKQSSVLSGTDSVEVTYGSSMPSAEAPTRNNYIFQGYFAETDGAGKQYYDAQMNSINDWDVADGGTIFAYWLGNPYTVTFDKQGGSGGTSSVTARYGAAMPTATAPTRTNYVLVGYFDEPNGAGSKYYDGPNMVSVKDWDKTTDTTLYAYWRGAYYTISYQNLTFMGKNAEVIWDHTIQENPNYYEYGVGLDLSCVSARWQPSGPYNPHLVFLGWYTDMNFTTKVTNIPATATGNKTYYAKWRYDFKKISRSGEYTITDADPYSETYYDHIILGLKYNNLYQDLKTIGINYIYIEFKLQIREINDGYQEVLIYKDTSPTGNPIWSVTDIEHDPSGVCSTAAYYIWSCAFEIDDIKDCDNLYIRYGAHGNGADTWVTESMYIDVMYTSTTDSEENIEKFTWDPSAKVDDEDCIPLENVSDSY